MNLEEVREHIDRIDAQLIELFNERLDLAPRCQREARDGQAHFRPRPRAR